MSKQLSPLKSAIQGLKINTPFDLRKQGQVTLTPPTAPQEESPPRKPPQKERPRSEKPPVVTASPVGPQAEAPQIEVPRRNGFFRLKHDVFADAELRALSGDAFRLFVWMSSHAWRYQDSDGTLRASIGFMVNGTGISHATVSRALGQLRERGMVELVQTDFKRGNIWKISNRAAYTPDSEGPQNQGPRDEGTSPSNRGSSALNSSEKPPQSEGEKRNSKNPKKPENSLAQIADETLGRYFADLKPARKLESELQAFWEIRSDYSEAEVSACFVYLGDHGLPGSGEPCHSPMAYLSKAIGQVVRDATIQAERRAATEAREQEEAEVQRRRSEEDALAEAETRRREALFLAEFPSAEKQQEALMHYSKQFPFFRSDSTVARSLAITAWWSERGERDVREPEGGRHSRAY